MQCIRGSCWLSLLNDVCAQDKRRQRQEQQTPRRHQPDGFEILAREIENVWENLGKIFGKKY